MKKAITGRIVIGRQYFHNPIRIYRDFGEDLMNSIGGGVAGAIGGVAGKVMGMAFEGHDDQRQLRQQQALQDMQIKGQKEMAEYNYQKQLQMWDQTNYAAQVQQLNKAGLNPALLYGKGGAGGATVGSQGGSVGMGIAPHGANSAEAAQASLAAEQLAMQMKQTDADVKLKEAQANALNQKVQPEVDQIKANIDAINQGVQNAKAQETLTEVQTQTARLQNSITGETIDDQIASIRATAGMAETQLQRDVRQGNLEKDLYQTKINSLKGLYLQIYLENNLIKAQTKNTEMNTDLMYQKIKESVNSIMQGWNNAEQNAVNSNNQNNHLQHMDMINDLPMSAQTAAGLTKLIGILKGGGPKFDKAAEEKRWNNYWDESLK